MFIDFLGDDGTGRSVIRAQQRPGGVSLPLESLIFDAAPQTVGPDEIAVAGTLLFGTFAEVDISFATDISRQTADAIREATSLVVASPISTREASREDPQPEEVPLRATTLSVGFVDALPARTPAIDHTRLGLVAGERFQGALFGVKEAVVASNAWLMATYIDPASVLLAAGVLFSRDFLAKELSVDDAAGTKERPSSAAEILCSAVRLGIS